MEVTATVTSPRNADIVERKLRARPLATQNIPFLRFFTQDRSVDILHGDIFDNNSISWLPGRPTVQVILLDINSISTDILDLDIAIGDACDISGGLSITLDPRAIRIVDNNAVLKEDVGDVVVGFPAYAADGEAVAAVTVHVADADVIA